MHTPAQGILLLPAQHAGGAVSVREDSLPRMMALEHYDDDRLVERKFEK